MHLLQLVVHPFVEINTAWSPALVGAEARPADRPNQSAVSMEGSDVLTFLELIIADDAGPAFKHLWKVGAAVARVDDGRDRTAGAASHRRDCVMPGEVNAFLANLFTKAGAIHARQLVAGKIKRRGLSRRDFNCVAGKARFGFLCKGDRRQNAQNEAEYDSHVRFSQICLCTCVIGFEDYREAVMQQSPGLPRFAATLGMGKRRCRNPVRVAPRKTFVPNVAFGNVELEVVTASRLGVSTRRAASVKTNWNKRSAGYFTGNL